MKRIMADVNLSREVRAKAREAFRQAFTRLPEGDTKMLLLSTEGRVLRELSVLTAKDKRILLELIRQPRISRLFIQNLAGSTLTPVEVLQLIARRSAWSKDTAIRRALLANAKTPRKTKDSLREGS